MVSMPHWPKKIIKQFNNQDLSRMEAILLAIGNPHEKLPKTIHIAGTNGKGSTCAMLKSIFIKAGFKAHVYTSPHILEFNERIVISNHIISDDLLFRYLEEVRLACEKINLEPTFFEATTAAAFLAFSNHEADILILETGMGGRLDPTNVIKNPILTIITPISYDHMEYLGPEISLIAREKAGIIKKNSKCVISRQDQRVMEILLEKCEELDTESIAYEYDFIPEKQNEGFLFLSQIENININKLGLIGDHQIINASAVIAAILSIKENFDINTNAISNGLAKVKWIGRLEKIDISNIIKQKNDNTKKMLNSFQHPRKSEEILKQVQDDERGVQNNNRIVQDDVQLSCWIDGAHNIAGAAALKDWIIESKISKPIIIIGLTKNRDVISILSQFLELEPKFLSVPVLSEPNSYSSRQIAEIAAEFNINVTDFDTLYEALEFASSSSPKPSIIITGSLFLMADIYKLQKNSA